MTSKKTKVVTAYKKYRKVKRIFSAIFIVLTFVMVAGLIWVIINGAGAVGDGLVDAIKDGLS